MSMLWEDFKVELFETEALKLLFEANELKVQIIKKLLEYLKNNNMTQEEFSKKVGVKQQAISRFIKGEINPRFDFIAKTLILLDGDIVFKNEKFERKKMNTIKLQQKPFTKISICGENDYDTYPKMVKRGA